LILPPLLALRNISKHFDGVVALSAVQLEISPGEIHCLVGENGSGKSTLIKIIAGVEQPEDGGEIRVDGTEQRNLTPARGAKLGIQVIYQDLSLFPNLSVAENIAISEDLPVAGLVRWRRIRAVASAAMSRVGIAIDPYAPAGDLPIAQRQLVAISRAIAADARLIIMDEPTASLTRVEVNALLSLAKELSSKGTAIVFVSHKLNEVLAIAERVSVLRDGRKAGTFPVAEIDGDRLAYLMTGKQFDYSAAVPPPLDSPVVLSTMKLGRAGKYNDVTFALKGGEILGVIGLLGSGRTELALSIFGLTHPDKGEIRLDGKRVVARNNRQAIQYGIAYVPEDRVQLGLAMNQPISSNICITILGRLAARLGVLAPSAITAAAKRWIARLDIKTLRPDNAVSSLSGGNQQRVVLAKWLATTPRVLILDNPTVGVDINAKDGIYEIIRQLAFQGMAIILISDEISEVLHHTHRIVVMRQGRLAAEFVAAQSTDRMIEDAING
jgi:simple sugar transport system ATP-binding protein